MADQENWQARYLNTGEITVDPDPCRVLQQYHYLLPTRGFGLDVACGLAGNGIFLARRGLQVHAWDYAEQAVNRVAHYAQQQGLNLQAQVRDLQQVLPASASYDVIVVSRFLARDLFPL